MRVPQLFFLRRRQFLLFVRQFVEQQFFKFRLFKFVEFIELEQFRRMHCVMRRQSHLPGWNPPGADRVRYRDGLLHLPVPEFLLKLLVRFLRLLIELGRMRAELLADTVPGRHQLPGRYQP